MFKNLINGYFYVSGLIDVLVVFLVKRRRKEIDVVFYDFVYYIVLYIYIFCQYGLLSKLIMLSGCINFVNYIMVVILFGLFLLNGQYDYELQQVSQGQKWKRIWVQMNSEVKCCEVLVIDVFVSYIFFWQFIKKF